MKRSFQEKSLWLMLASLVVAFGFYFPAALWTRSQLAKAAPELAANVMPPQVVAFVAAVAVVVVIAVVGHTAIAIADRRTETDERDRLIELKGTRNGAYVLATGVFLALTTAVFTEGNFLFTHVLLAFWVTAQLVEIASQLFFYRRGA